MSDHVPSYARHDAGRSPPPRARPAPRGSRHEDDRGHDRSGDRFGDRSPRGYDDRRDRDRRLTGGSRPDSPASARRSGDAPWEYGVVVTLRDAFGFVKGFKRGSGPPLFFPASEVRGGGSTCPPHRQNRSPIGQVETGFGPWRACLLMWQVRWAEAQWARWAMALRSRHSTPLPLSHVAATTHVDHARVRLGRSPNLAV